MDFSYSRSARFVSGTEKTYKLDLNDIIYLNFFKKIGMS